MVVALTLVLGLLNQALTIAGFNPIPRVTGFQSRESYQEQHISQRWYPAITYLNENLTADDKVLFLWEPRNYGTQVPHEADVLFDNWAQLVRQYGTAEKVAEGLRSEGVSHLLVNEYILPWIVADYPLSLEEKAAWEEFKARTLADSTVVYTDGQYLALYRLPAEKEP